MLDGSLTFHLTFPEERQGGEGQGAFLLLRNTNQDVHGLLGIGGRGIFASYKHQSRCLLWTVWNHEREAYILWFQPCP